MRTRTILSILLPLLAALLFAGCNADGAGIFYTINTEEKQSGGNFPMANQVLQADDGGTDKIFIRTGNSIRRLTGNNWSTIKGKDVDSIAVYNNTLYALIAEAISSDSSDHSYIQSWDGSSWSNVSGADWSDDSHMFTIRVPGVADEYIIVHATDDDNTAYSFEHTANFSTFNGPFTLTDDRRPFDGAFISSTGNYYIAAKDPRANSTYLYEDGDPTDGIGTTTITGFEGEIRSVTAAHLPDLNSGAGADILFFTTYDSDGNSRVYYYDGSLAQIGNATSVLNSNDTKVAYSPEAIDVVDIGGTEYLIVGASDGYFEADISDGDPANWGDLVPPSPATTDISSGDSFSAKYPDLDVSYVFSVYQTPSATEEFYLGVGKESGKILGGLWKRASDGSFSKQ